MKKLTAAILAICALALGAYAATRICVKHLYPSTMLVEHIDREADTVTLMRESGHMYAYYGASDEELDDVMSVLMFDNFTPIITDDVIVCARYSGF